MGNVHAPIPVIDLFAGPGGLGEGFNAYHYRRLRVFHVALAIEKDESAHGTLELRSFFRAFPEHQVPETYYRHLRGELTLQDLFTLHPCEARQAAAEAWRAELGRVSPQVVRRRIRHALDGASAWVLIGGPPCQAYSIAGRSRNRGVSGYTLEHDERRRLYQEYLRIVADLWPPIFVMENVKGLLSATIRDELLFERMCEDLRNPGRSVRRKRRYQYRILSLEEPAERTLFDGESVRSFVVRAEHHGIPQCRHRVILLGVREDLDEATGGVLRRCGPVPAGLVLDGLPPLRSGLSRASGRPSREADSPEDWLETLRREVNSRWVDGNQGIENRDSVRALIVSVIQRLRVPEADRGAEFVRAKVNVGYEPAWYLDDRIGGVCNHATRVHMDRDLHRYLFAACFAEVNGWSPRLKDFPPDLLPNHRNVPDALNGGFFNDRFRVQRGDEPATTITSHIHKDGHYYIHPDPAQCRSLTVREVARLQTFPDNYLFTGPRTKQYIQVGNAVPPLLAREIAEIVYGVFRRTGMTG
ncbi:MAG TPA: DNA cytosine methyltransferase [Phycisphaerae bacterium]|nr:DNA cytosine methyltransferase [Phycisphaerae bacterium]